MHPLRVCAALQPLVDRGAILVVDGGEFGQWVQAGVEAAPRLINGVAGAIGAAIPMAIATRLRYPERPVIAALGDGTFGFHAFELDTAARYRLPVVVVVGNDARWNAEHQLQLQHYGADRTIGCELAPSRYDRMAAALGALPALDDPIEPPLRETLGVMDLAPALADLGKRFEILENSTKLYAACHLLHATIDAGRAIRERSAPALDAIAVRLASFSR
jgi:acetolactate synthase-1/2/3 large subunit